MSGYLILFLSLLFLLIIAFKPVRGIYLILFLLPTYQIRFSVLGLPSTFLEIMIVFLTAVTFFYLVQKKINFDFKKLFAQAKPFLFFSLLFILSGLIAIFLSPVTIKALGVYRAYIIEAVIFAALFLILVDDREKFNKVIYSLTALIIYLGVFGIYQYFTLYRLPPAWWGPGIEPRRAVSLYSYPNALAMVLSPVLSFITALLVLGWSAPKSKLFNILLLGLVMGGVGLILTFSRGGWIGYLLSVVLISFFTPYRKILTVFFILTVCVSIFIPGVLDRIIPVLRGTDPAGLERIKLWSVSLEIIKNQPVFGAGLMGFREWYGALKESGADEILNYPHNFFLNFWIEIGLLGLLSVLSLMTWVFWRARIIIKDNPFSKAGLVAALAALVNIFAHGQVDAPIFKNDLAIVFWLFLAIVLFFQQTKTPVRGVEKI